VFALLIITDLPVFRFVEWLRCIGSDMKVSHAGEEVLLERRFDFSRLMVAALDKLNHLKLSEQPPDWATRIDRLVFCV